MKKTHDITRSFAAQEFARFGFGVKPVKFTFQGLSYQKGFDLFERELPYVDKNGEKVFEVFLGTAQPLSGGGVCFTNYGGHRSYCKTKDLFRTICQSLNLWPSIDFCADNCQYFRWLMGTHVGTGDNERDAYESALNDLCEIDPCGLSETKKHVMLLGQFIAPLKYGSPKKGIAAYFGREVAREHAKGDSDLYIFCTISLKK